MARTKQTVGWTQFMGKVRKPVPLSRQNATLVPVRAVETGRKPTPVELAGFAKEMWDKMGYGPRPGTPDGHVTDVSSEDEASLTTGLMSACSLLEPE